MVAGMNLTPPTAEQLHVICKEINLTQEQHRKDTHTLKEWLKTQPHLPHDIDDTILGSFLVGCKNSLERTKQTLDKYLSNRTSCPDIYSNRDPLDAFSRKQAKLLQYFPVPGMTPEGYRVTIYRMVSPDVSPADFTLLQNAIHLLSSYDVRFQEDPYWAGDLVVFDGQNFTFKHIQAIMNPAVVKKYIHCGNESLPVRYKKLIFINIAPMVEPFLMLMKKVMKDKMVKRMIISTENYTFLHKHIPKELLPDEYGGQAGSCNDLNNSWQLKVESYRDWFLKDMTRKVDESKRPETSKRYKNDFGVEGSFKTLTID